MVVGGGVVMGGVEVGKGGGGGEVMGGMNVVGMGERVVEERGGEKICVQVGRQRGIQGEIQVGLVV